jgi:lipopolysaccharide transport system permease protein
MILKSAQILVENRNIIKKSNIGIPLFLMIPFFQYIIHFCLLASPGFLFLYWMGELDSFTFVLGFIWIVGCGIFIHPFLSYISHCNVLLKDITPMLRIILQFGFWTLPILYSPGPEWREILSWNPFYFMLEGFRYFVLKNYTPYFNWTALLCFIILSFIFHFFSNKKLKTIVLDQL